MKYIKEFLIVIFGIVVLTLLFNLNTDNKNDSNDIKTKLDNIDKQINELNKQREGLDSMIFVYNQKIKNIDSLINNIKIQKSTINNFYEKRASEISKYDAKQTDSLLRVRYRY